MGRVAYSLTLGWGESDVQWDTVGGVIRTVKGTTTTPNKVGDAGVAKVLKQEFGKHGVRDLPLTTLGA